MAVPLKAVQIQILDAQKTAIKNASGFIVKELESLFLYTCWHVVTGFNMHDLRVGLEPPKGIFLKVNLQNAEEQQPGVVAIGGSQSLIIDLYDKVDLPRKPVWFQDKQDVPNIDLNAINLQIPFWHDAIKIPLPPTISVSDLQIVSEDDLWHSLVFAGDKLLISGYPYGYSASGIQQPTPVVLTRFVAATRIENRQREILIDGPGAPGMSGAPVFIEFNNKLFLFGIYTGAIFPDHVIGQNERTTALGTCCDMTIAWNALPLSESE
jgi:hypothetical protein